MKTVKSYIEVNKRFTDIVNNYLKVGYLINTASMNAQKNENEIAKVDLVDNITGKLIRVAIFRVFDNSCDYIIVLSKIKIDFNFADNDYIPFIHSDENIPFVSFLYKLEENNDYSIN